MKISGQPYQIIRQIHLYSSLTIVALLLMYVISSYMMIYHDLFHVETMNESKITLDIVPEQINTNNWSHFLKKNNIKGRMVRESIEESGDIIRLYESAKDYAEITIFKNTNQVEIRSADLNLSGKINEMHRLRGFGGPLIYNIYAVLLDLVGISLIMFVLTGVILWLKLLKHNKLAWTILILGFIYVSAVLGYLIFV